jgi:hypothetical protein
MALMGPLSITFLAIVVVVSGRQRRRPPSGRGLREPLPEHIPVPGDTEDPNVTDAYGPPSPEWVVDDDLLDPVQVGVHSYCIT